MSDFTSDLTELLEVFESSGFSTLEISHGSTRIAFRGSVRTSRENRGSTRDLERPSGPEARDRFDAVDTSGALKSPRVGRFFQLQDAQGTPVLQQGVELSVGQVYGIIESMHLRYEIRSQKEGVVDRVLVPSGESVEFGQPLVLLQP